MIYLYLFQDTCHQQIVHLRILGRRPNVSSDIVGLCNQLAVGIAGIQSQGCHSGGQGGFGARIGRIISAGGVITAYRS